MKAVFKWIYAILPLKSVVFTFLRRLNLPQSIYKHLHFKGVFTVKVPNRGTFKMFHHGYQLENEIFWAGLDHGWEKVSTRLWISLCHDASVIIDIGANTGIYSLIARTVNPQASVFAFEPVARVFQKFEQNLNLNNMKVEALQQACSNKDGSAVIYDPLSEHVYSVTVNLNTTGNQATKPVEIETIRLDTFIEQRKLATIDLIKIDVETHEPEVLEGLGIYLSRFKPTLLIEILNDEVGIKVQHLVQDKGYVYYNIDEQAGIRKVLTITKSDYYNYLICQPDMAAKLGL